MFALFLALTAFLLNIHGENPLSGNVNFPIKTTISENQRQNNPIQTIPNTEIPHLTTFNDPPEKIVAYNVQSDKAITKVSERAVEKSPVLEEAELQPLLTPIPTPTVNIYPSITPTIYIEQPSPSISPIVHPKINPIPCEGDRRGIASDESNNSSAKRLFTDEILCPL